MERLPATTWTGPRSVPLAGRPVAQRILEDRDGERAIVDAVLGGDREAFRELVDEHSEAVVRSCYSVLGDLAEAEDAGQEAFVIAYRSLGKWRAEGPFGAWLGRIAIRVSLRAAEHRRRVTWRTPLDLGRGSDSVVDQAVDRASVAAATSTDPAALTVQAERVTEIRDAVIALREPYREVVALRLFGDATLEDIARETDRSIATVKNHLHRGLVRLRERLGEDDDR